MADRLPLFLANQPVVTDRTWSILDRFNQAPLGEVSLADGEMVERAIVAAAGAAAAMRQLPAHARKASLEHLAGQVAARSQEFAQLICAESGKPISAARGEVERAIETFRIAAEESVRINGQWLPLDRSPRGENTASIVRRVPIGPCSFITPFNFPLNLVAHKIAPAIACGCPFILKPAPQTPISALRLGEILAQADLPSGAFSILPCENDDAAPLIEDDRMKLLSFTGSAAVGWALKARSGKKKVTLELGGNAACIIDRGVDAGTVVKRLVAGAFGQSGQSCISVQRALIHESMMREIVPALVAAAGKLVMGDPHDDATVIGPMITEKDAVRIESWIRQAVERGAILHCGGIREGSFVSAAVLEKVPDDQPLYREEAFGPVVIVERFSDFADACRRANDSKYGLQAGVFTNDLGHAMHAFQELEVGGVILNDVPTFRADAMPYGGVKESGLGREGIRSAIEDMTEPRTLVLRPI